MNLFKSYKPPHPILRKATLLFVLVSAVLIAADRLSAAFGLSGWQRTGDDLLGGLIAAAIFHLYERRRVRRLRQRLHLIDLMNHHIRNAMQPLMFVTFEPGAAAQMKLVEECVRHIDWALREVLPHDSEQGLPVHDGGFTGSRLKIMSSKPDSGAGNFPPPKPANRTDKPFFGHWLDAWRSRNLGARQ